ncbi:DUF1510 family protein [Bacillus sp. SB49]|uniref:YrrS family protein n=1 Tax=Bacillaceae TaxID=186817 RepID=UPI00042A641F|nr:MULTISPECIES: YrrS family protein [Bacillaceae]QHT47240.1 DUF1510 family protein [Bacillus sp. SB49]
MSEKHTSNSRSSRNEKKRRSFKWVTWLSGVGVLVVAVFISVMVFSTNDEPGKAKSTEASLIEKAKQDKEQSSKSKDDSKQKEESEGTQVSLEGFEELKPIEDEEGLKVEESEDPNVERVVTKDWSSVPTEQDTGGNHSITYQEGSQDYEELKQAIRKGVGLAEDDIIYWWIGNGGGPNKAVATVSDKSETGYLRVSVEWVDGQGYKPTKLEVLKEKEINR